MTSVSQENLRKLAIEAEAGGDYQAACGHLEEALRLGFDEDLALDLSRLLRLNKEEDQAYALIKALPDLFPGIKCWRSMDKSWRPIIF